MVAVNTKNENKDLSILVVEDELSFALELEILLREIGYSMLAVVDNSEDAMKAITAQQPDLILMDVDIRGRYSGVELAEQLAPLQLPILFITCYQDEVTYRRTQQVNALGYLVKPISKYTLITAIQSIISNLGTKRFIASQEETFVRDNTLFFKRRNVYEKIQIDAIDYIKAYVDYTMAFCATEQYILSITMRQFLNLLSNKNFLRTHRSYIVNIDKVTAVSSSENKLWINNVIIPISRRLKKEVLAQIHLIN